MQKLQDSIDKLMIAVQRIETTLNGQECVVEPPSNVHPIQNDVLKYFNARYQDTSSPQFVPISYLNNPTTPTEPKRKPGAIAGRQNMWMQFVKRYAQKHNMLFNVAITTEDCRNEFKNYKAQQMLQLPKKCIK